MKEATGELNMTVVTVVAIAAVAAFFYAFIWPNIKNNIQNSTKCSQAINCNSCNGNTCTCQYQITNDSGNVNVETITCPDNSNTDQN